MAGPVSVELGTWHLDMEICIVCNTDPQSAYGDANPDPGG